MPLTNYAFADLITFTRSTTATFVGSNGLIQSAAINAPRFDFNPVTLAPLGLLMEEQRVNLALYSEQFDNAGWLKTNSTITANATTSPDGTANADKITPTAVAGEHYARQTIAISTGASITVSIYVKADGYRSIRLRCLDSAIPANGFLGNLDTSTGSNGGSVVGAGTFTSTSAASVGNGWWRLTVTGNAGATAASIIFDVFVLPGDQNSAPSFTGDGTSGLFLWGAQLEVGAFGTSYIPTVASTVTRAIDSASITGAAFSPWYNQSEGTIIAQFVATTTGVTSTGGNDFPYVYDIDSAAAPTSGNSLLVSAGYGPGWRAETRVLGVTQAGLQGSMTLGNASVRKIAYAYRTNDFAASANGGAATTDTSGTLPTNDRMTIGAQNINSNTITGYMQRITYYPTRLTDAQLQALTS
jgi:hypothetical protein